MKILQVRFKNLNSLVGEWEIDFTLPAYTADGIFAITGPTGAGKTTILDAICLAIYGRTPRLDRVNKSVNEIMSRHTGECFAEVTFETQLGRYRCHWAQHRARRKPDGELQHPRQEISNADTGEIFESKKSAVATQIESVTGMDFDRFTRSMLLAQGGFAAFLQAAPDERAPILEQITGTAIYSDISIRVHERQRGEQDKLKLLRAEVAGIELLDAEEEETQREQLAEQEKQVQAMGVQVTKAAEAITWLRGIDNLKSILAGLHTDQESLQAEIVEFQPERDRLADALRAATLDGAYASLTALRQQQAQDQAALEAQQQQLPQLEKSVTQHTESLRAADQQLTQTKSARREADPLIQQVRSLDQAITSASERVEEIRLECTAEEQAIAKLREAAQAEQEKLGEVNQSAVRADEYMVQHAPDQRLLSDLTGLEHKLDGLAAKGNQVVALESEKQRAASMLEQATNTHNAHVELCETAARECSEATESLAQANAGLEQLLDGKLLREYRAEKESLLREMALLRQIAELEDHRAKLEDGKPCPLCGAEDHPYAVGNVPAPDETEQKIESLTALINGAEAAEQAIKDAQQVEQGASSRLHEAERNKTQSESQQQSARKELERLVGALTGGQGEYAELKRALEELLRPLDVAVPDHDDVMEVVAQLRERRDAWQTAVEEKARFEALRGKIQAEIGRLGALVDSQDQSLVKKRGTLAGVEKSLQTQRDEREKLFEDKDPNAEVAALDEAVQHAEQAEQDARAELTGLREQLTTASTQANSLQERVSLRTPELAKGEVQFETALTGAQFSGEAQFQQARLSPEGRTALEATAKDLETRQTQLQTSLRDRTSQLEQEGKKHITDKPLDALLPESEALQAQHRDLLSAVATLKRDLQKNDEAKALLADKHGEIDAQTEECRRWDNLHALIGSADGKKYRNFAQGLTFEMMVGHANRQLQKMSDRYLLVRDPGQPLELNVVDNYQAAEVRSTKNLSGGESFIVSLSLALGLSQMASRNVRVDSLFLDEGFGTLDEEALDTALETLSGLQQEGKLIGVISHVQALKERISTQIHVTTQTGGRSQISGPGCGRVMGTE